MTEVTQSETELIKIPYSKFLKLELPRFAQRLIIVVERHNPEELKVDKMFNLLVAEEPTIGRLIDKYGPHPLTEDLEKLRKDRSLRLSEIRFRLKVVIRDDKTGEDKDVIKARNAINHLFQNLESSKNEEMFNQKIVHFSDLIKTDSALFSALESLGFMEYIDKLQSVHAETQALITERSASMSERLEYSTRELKKGVLYATKNVVKQVELAPLLNPEIDYGPLYLEMNQLFTEFKNLVNKRLLFNARKAEEKAQSKVDNRSTQKATTTTTLIEEPSVKMLNIDSEGVNRNGQKINQVKVEPVRNEKAAATSSKTMQLPLVDNDNEALEK